MSDGELLGSTVPPVIPETLDLLHTQGHEENQTLQLLLLSRTTQILPRTHAVCLPHPVLSAP